MPDEKPVPKAIGQQVADLEKELKEVKSALAAVLVGMRDVIKFNGREHMPEGTYLGEEF
ncbi:MAG: hypothetical protein AB7T49_21620 [Oligoflexales bacterium]